MNDRHSFANRLVDDSKSEKKSRKETLVHGFPIESTTIDPIKKKTAAAKSRRKSERRDGLVNEVKGKEP